jgi:hypothetical protein
MTTPDTFDQPITAFQMHTLQGPGMHYGAVGPRGRNTYTMHEWDTICKQAASWGMRYVHPKVAEGALPFWYSDSDMHTMSQIARNYGLLCYPYHFVYGHHFDAKDRVNNLRTEAEMLAHAGTIFGGIIPDMEDAWENQVGWAAELGTILRNTLRFKGLVIPSIYANPLQHPISIVELNQWVDGYMPQVYFNVWTGRSAQSGLDFIRPQWMKMADKVWAVHQEPLKPLFPIISVTNDIPVHEIEAWIKLTGQHTGYCGFWYDLHYAPYAASVRALIPTYLPHTPPPPPKPPVVPDAPKKPVDPPVPVQTGPTTAEVNESREDITDEQAPPQKLVPTDEQLAALYIKNNDKIVFDLGRPICAKWATIMGSGGTFIGSPKTDEQIVKLGTKTFAFIEFDSGRRIYRDVATGDLILV